MQLSLLTILGACIAMPINDNQELSALGADSGKFTEFGKGFYGKGLQLEY
jgi:hypothetical protein